MTTKGKLAEQIIRLVKGGHIGSEVEIDEREVYLIIGQVINKMLKVQRFENMAEDDRQVSGAFIATYDNIAVETYKSKSSITLPAYPVALPLNMGVWHISPTDDMYNPFIPMQSGQYALVKDHVAGLLEGKTGYEVFGKRVVFTKDLSLSEITEVFVQLVIMDIDNYDETEPLPITPDMESDVVTQVASLFMGIPQSDKVVDNRDEK